MVRWASKLLGFAGNVIVYGCVTHCTFEYLGDFVVCNGPSMEPTLHSNDVLLTERISPRLSNISKGDIVIAKCPTNPRIYICKRVTGVSGDKILAFNPAGIQNSVAKEALEDIHTSNEDKLTYTYVPRGQVWLEGDNHSNSTDSRSYGAVPIGLVKSRVLCRLWPPKEMKILA